MKTKLFVVDTLVTFRHRYVIEAESLEHAYDEVTMKDSGAEADEFEEVSQRYLDEVIIDGRKIGRKKFQKMIEKLSQDEKEVCSGWMGDDLIRKIDYSK